MREKMVAVNRVTKVVKGGRILGFAALTVVTGTIGAMAAVAAAPVALTTAGAAVVLGNGLVAAAQVCGGLETVNSLCRGQSATTAIYNGISAAITAPFSILRSLIPSSEERPILALKNEVPEVD